jgi:hypothetical protein
VELFVWGAEVGGLGFVWVAELQEWPHEVDWTFGSRAFWWSLHACLLITLLLIAVAYLIVAATLLVVSADATRVGKGARELGGISHIAYFWGNREIVVLQAYEVNKWRFNAAFVAYSLIDW